jgi:hypothetical protein
MFNRFTRRFGVTELTASRKNRVGPMDAKIIPTARLSRSQAHGDGPADAWASRYRALDKAARRRIACGTDTTDQRRLDAFAQRGGWLLDRIERGGEKKNSLAPRN